MSKYCSTIYILAKDINALPEKPAYANIAKQIQDKKDEKLTANSAGPLEFDEHKFRITKPEKTFKLKMVKNPETGM